MKFNVKRLACALLMLGSLAFTHQPAYADVHSAVDAVLGGLEKADTKVPTNVLSQDITVPVSSIATNADTWLATNQLAYDAKRWTAVPYFTIANGAPDKYGGGVFVAYNVNDYLGAGIGLDYLGILTMPSGQVTIKAPLQPLKKIGLDWVVTPFAFAGLALPVTTTSSKVDSADSGSIGSIVGTGATVMFGSFTAWGKPITLGGGAAVTKWSGMGDYSGTHVEIFPLFLKLQF